jgi:GMP synthase (glutamine-hydrolysing)
MSIVLVDNGTTLLEKLRSLIPGEEQLVHYSKFDASIAEEAGLVVLSGSSIGPLYDTEDLYQKELDFIRTTTKPVIGICFGLELIVHAHGGALRELPEQAKGVVSVEVVAGHNLFHPMASLDVYTNHRWVVETVPESFEVLAKSAHGPEVIRHKLLPLYGMQFHPENMTDCTTGDEFFRNLFRQVVSQN